MCSIASVLFLSLSFLFAAWFCTRFCANMSFPFVFLFFTFSIIPWSLDHPVNILPTNENRRPAIAGSFKKKKEISSGTNGQSHE
jgi:hypothetical protein